MVITYNYKNRLLILGGRFINQIQLCLSKQINKIYKLAIILQKYDL